MSPLPGSYWRAMSSVLDRATSVGARVDDVLRCFVEEQAKALSGLDGRLGALTVEVADLVAAGGKRLRPAFVYWGHRAAGGGDEEATVHVGAAVEMLHTFALLHDDVMDRADTRRGRAAAAHAFTRQASERGAADPAWFGTSAAILAGDLAFVWADRLLDTTPAGAAAAARLREVFTTLRLEVMAGQYLDLCLDGGPPADPETACRIALLKSGRYTVTRPLQLGLAIVDDVGADLERALQTYGDAIGVAFQLRDDILGLFGDPARTGKGCLDDIRAGKRTLLISRALALAAPGERRVLDRALGDRNVGDEAVAACRDIVAGNGALASVEELLRSGHDAAVAALRIVPDPARSALCELAAAAVGRDH